MRKLLFFLLLLVPVTHLQAQESVVCQPAPVSAQRVLFSAPDAFGVVYTCYLTTPVSESASVLPVLEASFVEMGVPLPVESVPEDIERVCHRTTHPVGERIATYYNVPLSDVLALHCMGYGFGNINRAYATALAEGTSAAVVLVAERDGITWQEQSNAQTSNGNQSNNGNGNGNNGNGNGNNGNGNGNSGNGNGNNGNGNGNNGNGNGNNGNGNGNNGNGNGNNGNGNGNNGNGNGNNGNGNGNNGNGNGNNGNGNGNNGNGNGNGGKGKSGK